MTNSTATLVASTLAKGDAAPLQGTEILRLIVGGVSKQCAIDDVSDYITSSGVQSQDDLLDSIAALTFGADSYIYGTGSDTAAAGTITSVGRTLVAQTTQALARTTGLGFSANGSSLVSAADYAAMKVLLSLTIGTDVQAWDAQLDTWSGITPGTGVGTALAVNVGSAGAFVTFNGAGGTPASLTLTNATGLPVTSGISGLGTGIATALAVNTGSAGAPVLFNGAGGTPASLTLTNATGLPTVLVANEATDTTCFPLFATAATGELGPKTVSSFTLNSNTGALGATSITVGNTGLTVGASAPFSDSAGTLTLQNVDALDATTESTIEAAIDTLANLTSIQGLTVTLADAAADRLFGWDDSESAYKNIAAGDLPTEGAPASGDFLVMYDAGGVLRKVDWDSLPGAGGGISNVSEDTSPSLGGPLDGDGFDVIDIGVITLREQAAAEADVAGLGQIWVQTATPNLLMFTDDAGTDFQVATLTGTETFTNKTLSSSTNTYRAASTTVTGASEFATSAEYIVGTDTGRSLVVDQVWGAGALTTLNDSGGNIAVDMSTGINFAMTMDGDYTLSNPTNPKIGQTGAFVFTQDGTGTQTLAYGTNYEFAGGSAFVLSTAAGTKDIIFYWVQSATSIVMTGILRAVA